MKSLYLFPVAALLPMVVLTLFWRPFFVTRAVSPVNCIKGKIIKEIKKKSERIIKARNISYEVSLPFSVAALSFMVLLTLFWRLSL